MLWYIIFLTVPWNKQVDVRDTRIENNVVSTNKDEYLRDSREDESVEYLEYEG